jgi:hypothetical protein
MFANAKFSATPDLDQFVDDYINARKGHAAAMGVNAQVQWSSVASILKDVLKILQAQGLFTTEQLLTVMGDLLTFALHNTSGGVQTAIKYIVDLLAVLYPAVKPTPNVNPTPAPTPAPVPAPVPAPPLPSPPDVSGEVKLP